MGGGVLNGTSTRQIKSSVSTTGLVKRKTLTMGLAAEKNAVQKQQLFLSLTAHLMHLENNNKNNRPNTANFKYTFPQTAKHLLIFFVCSRDGEQNWTCHLLCPGGCSDKRGGGCVFFLQHPSYQIIIIIK